MSHDVEYLASVPVDILRNIVQELDAMSTIELARLCNSNVRYRLIEVECKRRLSVPLYLDRTFTDGKKLLRALAVCDGYIWGGKVLGFYVTNKLSDSCSWNISVPRHNKRVVVLMKVLEDMGVVWHTAVDDARAVFDNGNGAVVMDSRKYRRYMHDIYRMAIQEYGYHVDLPIHTDLSGKVKISLNDKCVSVSGLGFCDDSFTRQCDWTCIGTLRHSGFTDRIRIGGEETGSMSAVMGSHSSCTQAIIFPHVTIHLYGKLACSMNTYGWYERVKLQANQDAVAWNTIRRCGFKYIDAQTSSRSAMDDDTIVVSYTDACGPSSAASSSDAAYHTSMRWKQQGGGLSSLIIPYSAHTRGRQGLADELYQVSEYGSGNHTEYLHRYIPWIQ